jgi:site-specific recombinase XerD
MPPQPALTAPLTALLEWQAMAEGAYSPNTLRAQKADGALFQVFCERLGESFLPADPKTIRAFIEHETKQGKKPATIKRYVATIARVHLAAQLLNPCSSEAVRLGLKKMGREMSARQDQAHPLGWKEIKEFIESAGEGLRADRERAMLCVAYETLARRGELVALEVRDLDFHPDATGQALIRRGKTDPDGQGRLAYLSRETVPPTARMRSTTRKPRCDAGHHARPAEKALLDAARGNSLTSRSEAATSRRRSAMFLNKCACLLSRTIVGEKPVYGPPR